MGGGRERVWESLASTTCSSHPDFGVAVLAHSLVHSSWDVIIMRHHTILFFFFKHGRLLPDEVCNVIMEDQVKLFYVVCNTCI